MEDIFMVARADDVAAQAAAGRHQEEDGPEADVERRQQFGDGFNVVGIIGRGSNPAVLSKVKTADRVDWLLAYQVPRSNLPA